MMQAPVSPTHHSPAPMYHGYQAFPSQGYMPYMNMYGQPMQPAGGMYGQQMQSSSPSGMYSPLGQHKQFSAPPMGPAAVPATPYAQSPASKCRIEVAVPMKQSEVMKMMELTWLDQYFWERSSTPSQCIGFRFSHVLDPNRTAQSLQLAVDEYPVIGSKVVMHYGKAKFQLEEERIVVHLVLVEPETLKNLKQLHQISDIVCPKSADQKQNPLFQAFLFRCKDEKHGAGDAGSYALFMRKWSQCYEKLSGAAKTTAPPQLPPVAFNQTHLLDPRYKRIARAPPLRSFLFSESRLAKLKKAAMAGAPKGEILSTNDILCAQCACALAPTRFKEARTSDVNSLVRISILIDFRGTSNPLDTWGNRWSDIAVNMPWAELLSGDALAVARRIRSVVAQEREWMKNDMARFDLEKNRRNPNVHRLFTWNSWAKAGDLLRTADFKNEKGKGVQQEIKWLNAGWLPTTDIVVIEPLAASNKNDPQIAIKVASWQVDAASELAALRNMWTGVDVVEEL